MAKTIAQELFDAAATIKGSAVTGYPRTIAGGVDALADAVAGEDVPAGRTIAQAVAALGTVLENGGGGGVTLGNFGNIWIMAGDSADDTSPNPYVFTVKAGSSDAVMYESTGDEGNGLRVAHGLNVAIETQVEALDYNVTAELWVSGGDTPAAFTDFTATKDGSYCTIEFAMPDCGDYETLDDCGELSFYLITA